MADITSDATSHEEPSIDEREALAWFRADPDVLDERIRVNSTAQRHAAVIVRAAMARKTGGAVDTPVTYASCGGCGHVQAVHEFYRDSPDDACTAPGCGCGAFEDPTPDYVAATLRPVLPLTHDDEQKIRSQLAYCRRKGQSTLTIHVGFVEELLGELDRHREIFDEIRDGREPGESPDRQSLASTILDSFATHDGKTWQELAEHAAAAVIRAGEAS